MSDVTPGRAALFRLKPFEVEAVRWTGANEAEVQRLTGGGNFFALDEQQRANCDDPGATAEVYYRLHSTWELVLTGQWVIKGLRGEFFRLDDSQFREAYEPAAPPGLNALPSGAGIDSDRLRADLDRARAALNEVTRLFGEPDQWGVCRAVSTPATLARRRGEGGIGAAPEPAGDLRGGVIGAEFSEWAEANGYANEHERDFGRDDVRGAFAAGMDAQGRIAAQLIAAVAAQPASSLRAASCGDHPGQVHAQILEHPDGCPEAWVCLRQLARALEAAATMASVPDEPQPAPELAAALAVVAEYERLADSLVIPNRAARAEIRQRAGMTS